MSYTLPAADTIRPTVRCALLGTLILWQRRLSTRRALAGLETAQLEDIGLTEAERRAECAKPFWK
jgi:uncharacterized protein YjiS (DUF1127 family)